ncbi:cobalamin biosynthesis protein CobD/CbiB [Actinokineospora baliensis]|uniref:hypothetical protein n=1 Tax=Actinokineospora baliensis TaxID=547056 RepID=UPI00195AF8B9|nr:hypothetical protein [Actinokineospora baliensis]MBM7775722.1 cobalamin biosynthesis protein CobD/CbiB [Actinokineospora baliensis]
MPTSVLTWIQQNVLPAWVVVIAALAAVLLWALTSLSRLVHTHRARHQALRGNQEERAAARWLLEHDARQAKRRPRGG